jgi:hypothetical protein
MANTALVKTILHKSLAEGVYRDLVTRTGSYYYFLGKTLGWTDEDNPPYPIDSLKYEHDVRNEIITLKEIRPSDIAFVIPRREWVDNELYDMYDDQYCDEVIGVDIISGGTGYIDIYDISLSIEGGGGSGATAVVTIVEDGEIAGITLTSRGYGYNAEPTIVITSSSGSGAVLKPKIGISSTGKQKIEEAAFYVVTDEYNVYKCLDNNNNSRSTVKPTGTALDPFETSDGYIWKFMYNIPINLRNKFYTDEYIPVVSALTNHFYSNGTIDNIFIANRGKNYTSATVSVLGDGYREADPIYVTGAAVVQQGTGYQTPSIIFSDPVTGASPFTVVSPLTLGQKVFNSDKDFYEVMTPGTTTTYEPNHRFGTVLNGTAALRYIGSTLKGSVTTVNPKNITKITVTTGGAGYLTPPTVTILDGTGTGAQATAVIGTFNLSDVIVTNGGSGYLTPPVLTVYGGGGTGAQVQAILTGGTITDVMMINQGSGYTSAPTILVEGSGTGAVLTPVMSGSPVTEIIVTNGGAGYTSPVVTITGGSGAAASATATVETGVISDISLRGSIRDVIIVNSGSGYLTPPDVNITGDGTFAVVKSKIYQDKVISTYVINAGYDYVLPPTVTFGTQYSSFSEVYTNDQLSNGSNLYTVVQAGVTGSSEPTHSTGTVVTSPAWNANTTVVANQTVYVSNRMYKCLNGGLTGSSEPTHSTGTVMNGAVNLQYIGIPASLRRDGETATGYAVLRYGAGYSETPKATFIDATGKDAEIGFYTAKSEAKITPIVANGQLVYIVVDDPGVGYTKAELTVSGDGVGASLQADLSLGAISSQQANNEILTPEGTIDAIAIISGGYSYGVANISIYGDGEGAEAVAVIDPDTKAIKKVNIVNRGSGYTWADVIITGNGNGASLRAIVSPFGGHGKNAPEELFATSLMLYSNISTDLNQGVVVSNDYRQVGIIKNPRVFNGLEVFQGTVGSCCYIVQAPIDTTKFKRDDEVYVERTNNPSIVWEPTQYVYLGDFLYYEDRIYTVVVSGLTGSVPPTHMTGTEKNGFCSLTYVGSTKSKKRYRIVSITPSTALVQSLDNDIPGNSDVFINTQYVTYNFTATTIGYPTVDKYSGQMMYIDNKQGFTPSGDETITLRTIINF